MSRLRRFALGVGVASVVAGIAVVAVPGLAAGIGLNPSSVVIGVVGVVALLAGAAGIRKRLRGPSYRADLPDPERRAATTVPGAEIDAALGNLSVRSYAGLRNGRQLRERIRAAGMDVLGREGYTETQAEAAFEAGTWTDDPYAAAFLGDGRELPVWLRFRDVFGREATTRRQARHAIHELGHLLDADEPAKPDRAASDHDRAGSQPPTSAPRPEETVEAAEEAEEADAVSETAEEARF